MPVREYYLKNKEVFQVARRTFSPQNVETPFAALIPFRHFATPYRVWLYISQLLLEITLLYEENKKRDDYIQKIKSEIQINSNDIVLLESKSNCKQKIITLLNLLKKLGADAGNFENNPEI